MNSQREMTLAEWVAQLPPIHAARKEFDQLRQRLAEVEAKRDLNAKMLIEELTRNEHLEAKLALAEQDARRLDWLEAHPNELRFEPFSRSGQAWACCPSTKIGNDGRPHSYVGRFATARAAIDASGHESLPPYKEGG